jgi:hypothetical protein
MSKKKITTDAEYLQSLQTLRFVPPRIRRRKKGEGVYIAPRSDLKPGAVTRREWLRFLHQVALGDPCHCTPENSHHHWLWMGHIQPDGYGMYKWRGRDYKAHRFACIALGQVIPEGFEPDHLCRIRHCCQVACLEIVTKQVNIMRGNGVGAKHAREIYCKNGHRLAGDNLVQWLMNRHGLRRCRLCRNALERVYDHRNRAAKKHPIP